MRDEPINPYKSPDPNYRQSGLEPDSQQEHAGPSVVASAEDYERISRAHKPLSIEKDRLQIRDLGYGYKIGGLVVVGPDGDMTFCRIIGIDKTNITLRTRLSLDG